jgi:UDP-glucose 4-epimerase
MAESLCAEYSRAFGVETAIVRLFSAYGPGLEKQLLWDACQKLMAGPATFYGDGLETRDLIHVRDAAALLELAVERASTETPIVNGGTGHAPTIAAIVAEAQACLGTTRAVNWSGGRREGDPAHFCANIDRARAWNWSPTCAWRDGLREYCDWYLSRTRR